MSTSALTGTTNNLIPYILPQTELPTCQSTSEIDTQPTPFENIFAEMQKITQATFQENQFLKKEIVQLKAEGEKNTQAIRVLTDTVESLTERLKKQENNFHTLVEKFNAHQHQVYARIERVPCTTTLRSDSPLYKDLYVIPSKIDNDSTSNTSVLTNLK